MKILTFLLFLAASATADHLISAARFGADGRDTLDDAAAIQMAVDSANRVRGRVFLPSGRYYVSRTIHVTRGTEFGCRIEGEDPVGTVLVSRLPGSEPVLSFRGGSGTPSNTGARSLRIKGGTLHAGTGILIDGQDFAHFEDIRLDSLKYGVWLRNESEGAFGEANQFQRFFIDHCLNGIRMEQGSKGQGSFHGNSFENCLFTVGAGETGFNHVSGHYYNGTFRLLMWANHATAVYVNADGLAEKNIGNITFEGQNGAEKTGGRLTGKGRFWFSGTMQFAAGESVIQDESAGSDGWRKVFACDNYWRPSPYRGTDMRAGPLSRQTTCMNGPIGFFQSFRKDHVESVLLNTYKGPGNGFYLGYSGYQQCETEGSLGLFLAADGSHIRSFHSAGVGLRDSAGSEVRVEGGGLRFRGAKGQGYQVLTGTAAIRTRPGVMKYGVALPFKTMAAGRLILASGDGTGAGDPSSTFELHWTPGEKKIEPFLVHRVPAGSHEAYLDARFDGTEPRLLVGSNRDAEIGWTFMGVAR